jgi:hypothetical protein
MATGPDVPLQVRRLADARRSLGKSLAGKSSVDFGDGTRNRSRRRSDTIAPAHWPRPRQREPLPAGCVPATVRRRERTRFRRPRQRRSPGLRAVPGLPRTGLVVALAGETQTRPAVAARVANWPGTNNAVRRCHRTVRGRIYQRESIYRRRTIFRQETCISTQTPRPTCECCQH